MSPLKQNNNKSKSIFAQKFNKNEKLNANSSHSDPQHNEVQMETSSIIQDTELSKEIHEENQNILSQMREEEILAERQKLLSSLGKKEHNVICFYGLNLILHHQIPL